MVELAILPDIGLDTADLAVSLRGVTKVLR
jgi:hypothetical protein